jgi:glycosyltransferase involved in cell wall biosynthesis
LVDVERFKPGLPQQKMTIGYIGSFGVKDGIPHLLKATAEARKTIPQLKLRLIGFCENRPHIERLIYEFGMERSVEITGAVLYHEVPALLGGCDLLMMSRINTSYANYGFPTKLGEYLALGIPVIASKVSDIEKYIQHEENALLVDPENIHQLTSYIIKSYYEEERYTSMGLKGRAVVLKYFTHTQAAEKLIAICRQAIKK